MTASAEAGNSSVPRKLQQQQKQPQQQQQQRHSLVQQPGDFAVGLRILTGKRTYTDVYLKGTLAETPGAAAAAVSSLSVWLDRTHAGSASNTTYAEGGPVPLPADASRAWLVPEQRLGLSVFVDHSVVEVYALGGLARVSSRIYPEADDVAWGLAAWGAPPTLALGGAGGGRAPGGGWQVLMDAAVWEMQNAWLPPDC